MVKVLRGKDRGKSGKVTQVFVVEGRVVVDGMNKIKKHLRAKGQDQKGQTIELYAPFPVAAVALICPKCSAAIRVGYKMDGQNKRRVCRKCNQFID